MAQAQHEMFIEKFQALIPKYLDDNWTAEEGYSRSDLDQLLQDSELPAGTVLPQVLEEFYLTVGQCQELMEAHLYFFDPDELVIEDSHLLFIEDEDETWAWGIPLDTLGIPDPLVRKIRQDKHSAGESAEWVDEDATVSEFIFDLLDFSFEDDA